jgi:hypothetical protein
MPTGKTPLTSRVALPLGDPARVPIVVPAPVAAMHELPKIVDSTVTAALEGLTVPFNPEVQVIWTFPGLTTVVLWLQPVKLMLATMPPMLGGLLKIGYKQSPRGDRLDSQEILIGAQRLVQRCGARLPRSFRLPLL